MKEKEQQFDVDLVYLWVDGNDPVWLSKRNAFFGNVQTTADVSCKGRYANNDELKYSLRSIEKNAPWIRNIYIVTDEQTPDWLDTSNPRIHLVDIREIIPEKSLPCYNSSLIEHFWHKLPGLAEHFLYSNDDMYINRPVTRETFYDPKDGFPIVRLFHRPVRRLAMWMKQHVLHKPLTNYAKTIHHAATLVLKKYGKYFNAKPHHNIDAYLKSDYEHTFETFRDEIEATLENHIRKPDDVQRVIYTYVPLAEKRAHKKYVDKFESSRFGIRQPHRYLELDERNPIFFCMNDSDSVNDDDRIAAKEFLMKRFPEKSQFEK